MATNDGVQRSEEVGNRNEIVKPIIVNEDAGYAPHHFLIPVHYEPYIQEVLIPEGMIKDRIEKLARDIKDFYQNEELHLLCILKGSRGFFTMLLHYLNKIHAYSRCSVDKPPFMEHYVRIKSYINDKASSNGSVQSMTEDLTCLKNKNILIVEDIIDTGATLTKFCSWLKSLEPKHVSVASLLVKRTPASLGFKGDFVGFSIPDSFVVGFSLDYNEMFRDLEHICVLNEKGQKEFAASKK